MDINKMTTEQRNEKTMHLDELSTEDFVALMNQEDQTVAQAIAKENTSIARVIDTVIEGFKQGGRLIYMGAGQVGAALALWVRCRKNKKIIRLLKGALPAGILGIGEPLIYGVTLPLGRPFITACIGGGIGGAVIGGIGHIGAVAIGPSGLSLIPLIYDNMYLGYIAGILAAYAGGFIATYFFGTTKEMTAPQDVEEEV